MGHIVSPSLRATAVGMNVAEVLLMNVAAVLNPPPYRALGALDFRVE